MTQEEEEEEDTYWIAAVEAGGTSFQIAICQVVTGGARPTIVHRREIPSDQAPHVTLEACASFFKQFSYPYRVLGIATFGPVGLRPEHPETYGRILSTSPKEAWRNVDLLTPLREACLSNNPHIKVRLETDVNAPAWAEYLEGNGKISSCAYITGGTGVGVGLVVNHKTVHGRMHPEGGHVAVLPLPTDTFGGYSWGTNCPYGGQNTVEGLASAVALTERLQTLQSPDAPPLQRSILSTLPDDHEIWDHAANALASLCTTLLLTLSIEKIVLGGGVMKRPGLLQKIQRRTVELINGYIELPITNMSTLITTSAAGEDAGLVGAIVLAQSACCDEEAAREQQKLTKMKQTAFTYGIWHRLLVGSLLTAVLCKRFYRTTNK
ncbi:fructokinase [Fistulifera solaris]|uniref:fructokinase n=1 Tax=Fistulifera solaris TaxID=1519565 RepID=A0A1Z5J8T1_FISSO|nr:fructokinase [Fistulifera solaris]|eukprot:GAX10312.1 fructokinase [Fistulifera solaris]